MWKKLLFVIVFLNKLCYIDTCGHVYTALAFLADYCYNEGAISQHNISMVTACVNGSSTSVCYPDDYDVAVSLAVAACYSKGMEYNCEF